MQLSGSNLWCHQVEECLEDGELPEGVIGEEESIDEEGEEEEQSMNGERLKSNEDTVLISEDIDGKKQVYGSNKGDALAYGTIVATVDDLVDKKMQNAQLNGETSVIGKSRGIVPLQTTINKRDNLVKMKPSGTKISKIPNNTTEVHSNIIVDEENMVKNAADLIEKST